MMIIQWGINIDKNDKLEALISILVEKKLDVRGGKRKQKHLRGSAPNVS